MSLINDALKRARHAQKKNPPPTPGGTSLRPVELVRRKQSHFSILLPLALLGLIGVGGLVVWFAVDAVGARSSLTTVASAKSALATAATKSANKSLVQLAPRTSTPKPAIAQPVAPPVTTLSQPITQQSPAVVAVPISPVAPVSPQARVTTPQTIPAPTSTTATGGGTQPVAVVSGLPPPPPLPKLQGIFYRPERPAALLDGRMMLVGRMSGDYRVVAISQQSVTVVRAGQTNVLEMPD